MSVTIIRGPRRAARLKEGGYGGMGGTWGTRERSETGARL